MPGTLRVLYVDDEPGLLEIGKMFLEHTGDFSVETIDSAISSIELLQKEQFDAIVSDYQMPGMDGIQFLIEVRAKFGAIPFILFTGKGREEVVIKAINEGADFYLQKGGQPEAQFAELSNKIRYAAQRRTAEKEAGEAGERYKALIAVSNTGAWEYYATTDYLWCSPEYFSMLGRDASQFDLSGAANLRETWTDLIHPDDRDRAVEHFTRYLDNGSPGMYENQFRLQHADGHWVWILSRGSTLRDGNGNITRKTVGTHIDFTKRKLAEEALLESEEKFRSLAESSPDYIMRYDRQCRHIYMNPAALRVSGLTEEQIIGKTHRESGFDEAQSLFWEEKITGVFETGKPYQTQFDWQSVDGRVFLDWMLTPELSEEGTVRSVLGVSRDITQLKLAEETLLKKNEELNASFEQLAAAEEELRGNLDEMMRAQREIRESEERFRSLIQNSSDIIRIINAEGLIVYDSPSSSRILGYPEGFTVGKSPLEFIHPDDQELVHNALHEVYSHSNPGTPTEFRIRKADGSYIFVETIATNLLEFPGIDGIITTTRPIDERKKIEHAMRESEEQSRTEKALLRSLIDALPFDVWAKNTEGRYILQNPESIRLWGDCRNKATAGLVYPQDVLKHWQENSCRAMNGETVEGDFIWETGERQRVYHEIITPVKAQEGTIGIIGVNIDITGRKQAEEALAESEGRFRDLFNIVNSGIAIYEVRNDGVSGKDYIIRDFNKRALEIEGKQKDEVIGQSLSDLRPAIDEYGLIPVFRKVWKTGVPEYFPQKIYIDENYSNWYENRVFRLQSGEIVAVYDDITDRERVNEALKMSRVQLTEAMDMAHLVNWEFDVCTGIFTFDDRFYAFYGTTAELEGGNRMPADIYAKKFLHPDDRYMVADEVNKAIQATDPGYVSQVEHRIIRRDGETRYIVVRYGITKDEHGRTIRTHGVNQDITDRKLAEEAIRQANEKLNLLSGITRHDINNQLTVLQGYMRILERRHPDTSSREYFQKAAIAAQHIMSMIQFTKEYENIGVNAPAWQDCRTIVDNAALQVPLGTVTFKNDLLSGPEVYADPMIARVFYNLVDNAVRYGGKITTIRFSAEEHNGSHVLVCEDDGEGILPGEKEKIFERGFGKNTGMGLFLVREILAITGITIAETGEPGKGARFEMIVPNGAWRFVGA